MNPTGIARFRHRKSPSSDRLLGVFLHTPLENPNAVISGTGNDSDELNEDEVFWTGDFTESNHHHNSNPPSTSTTPRSHHHHNHKGFGRPEISGILAALPENETRSVFNHKASVSSSSSSSSSSSRMIPAIPKPPPPHLDRSNSISSSVKYPQSAPVNVPLIRNATRRNREFDEIDVDDEEREGEILPPHEIAERESVHSPFVSCSVLEGAGRTLKGRDLRQVRNAVWRRTGIGGPVKLVARVVKKLS